MDKDNALDVGIVGLGWWGKIVADHMGRSKKLRLVRASDVSVEAEGFASSRGIPFSTSFADVLKDPRVKGVVLCTPHSQHADQVVAAAQAGKHVFCEKPFAL